MTHHNPNLGEVTTFTHIVYFVPLRGTHIRMAFCFGIPLVPKLSWFELPRLCKVITFCSDLRLGWGLKQNCISPWELSNDVSYSTYTHRGRVDSWLLVVKSQIASLIPDLSFCHNLCYQCPNGPCKAIFDIYTLITFQWYKEHPNVRCFDPCNQTLKFRKSRKTPKSQF